MNVVDFAYQVIDLHEQNQRLKGRNAMLEEDLDMHREDLKASIKSGEQQMAGWLELLLTKKIVPRDEVVS